MNASSERSEAAIVTPDAEERECVGCSVVEHKDGGRRCKGCGDWCCDTCIEDWPEVNDEQRMCASCTEDAKDVQWANKNS